MLKITRTSDVGNVVLRFEGKLLEPWLAEARDQVERGLAAADVVSLDLSKVSFVDESGAGFLRALALRGIQIRGCSSFVAELLQLERA